MWKTGRDSTMPATPMSKRPPTQGMPYPKGSQGVRRATANTGSASGAPTEVLPTFNQCAVEKMTSATILALFLRSPAPDAPLPSPVHQAALFCWAAAVEESDREGEIGRGLGNEKEG